MFERLHFSSSTKKNDWNNDQSKHAFFQPKLSVNQPDDVYEQEANSVADKIVNHDNVALNSFFSPAVMQRKANKDISSCGAENYIENLQGGNSLNHSEKSFFESKMNYDFSNVRIHNDSNANQSAKNLNALAYTYGNDIVFAKDQYHPNTEEGKKLMAHELTHVMQQNNGVSKKVQARRELDTVKEKERYAKCLAAIDNVIKKLEGNANKQPDDIKEAIKLLRKKFTENKIKCYELDGIEHGITNFTTGEIYMDAKPLDGAPDIFANIGEKNVLHEGIHALHNEKYPVATKKYGKALDDEAAGKPTNLSDAELKDFQKLKAWTEYWAYRKMFEYDNISNNQGKGEDEIHSEALKRIGGPMAAVRAFDKSWDPRKWKPNN